MRHCRRVYNFKKSLTSQIIYGARFEFIISGIISHTPPPQVTARSNKICLYCDAAKKKRLFQLVDFSMKNCVTKRKKQNLNWKYFKMDIFPHLFRVYKIIGHAC